MTRRKTGSRHQSAVHFAGTATIWTPVKGSIRCPEQERMEVVRSNGLCLGCLKYGYMKKDCRGRKICTPCKGFHPTSLHLDAPMTPQHNTKPAVPPASASTEATSHQINTHDPKNKHKLLQLPLVNCLCLVASQR